MKPEDDITGLLLEIRGGNRHALDAMLPLIYDELSSAARIQLRRQLEAATLNTTSLVHETYIKLCKQRSLEVNDRRHFLAVASIIMRRLVANHARDRRVEKRGGTQSPLSLEECGTLPLQQRAEHLIAVDEALEQLQTINARAARVVECRYFAGLSLQDTADALGVGVATVKRDWNLARAWLKSELSDEL